MVFVKAPDVLTIQAGEIFKYRDTPQDGEEWESLVPTSTAGVIREIGGVGRLKIVSSRDSM